MSFFFQTLYSGSEGNCCLVGCDGQYILIDAGRNCKAILNALSSLSISVRDISAIFITHEHSDHISALDVVAKNYKIPVFANGATAAEIRSHTKSLSNDLVFELENYSSAKNGALCVTPFPLPHDSVSCSGYVVEAEGKRLVVATDMGYLTGEFASAAKDADAVVIESNYDEIMLQNSRYPEYLKRRISSKYGHLSNTDCAEAVSVLARRKAKKIMLAHLSKENNTPDTALSKSRDALISLGATVCHTVGEKADLLLAAAPRYTPSERIII
ncbi:MAG: MBL fold metallo-hydrolase [Clostridia bacterium]|nr:MBL fold metallo-hydrolase [Clostridia bacterium]MBR2327290.1 MBL fold metallo-hydrolase [Clostridia bacterium]